MNGTSPQKARSIDARTLFDKLFELAPDAMVVADAAGRITQMNEQVERLFGYRRDELLGHPVEILIPERFHQIHPTHRSEYGNQPPMRPMGAGPELYGRRKDGSEFPIDVMLAPVETTEGRVVLSIVRDISEKRRAEEALRRSEQQVRSIVENVTDCAIFLLDPEGRISTWNPGAERIKGYRKEEIIGRHFDCFFTPEDIGRKKPQEILRAAAGLGQHENEGWRIRKDGSHFWANEVITAIRDNNGPILGFATVTRDSTDHKRTEEALLLELSRVLLSTLDIQNMLSAFSASIQQVVPHDYAALALHHPETNGLRVQILKAGETSGSSSIETVLPLKGSAAGQVFTTREPLLLSSFDSDRFVPETFRHLRAEGLKSACWLPLLRQDRVLGTLIVASRHQGAFNQQNLDLLGHLASQVATAFDNAIAFRQIKELSDRLIQEKRYLEEELKTEYNFEEIIGESPALKRVLAQVEKVAMTDATVLILGETGTGKELVARSIHRLNARRERTMVKLNCAAIPAGLLESELFGHEKGAFTGAVSQKIGRLELAHGGTLFLDEVGDISLELQPKILRALQEKEFERLGSTRTIPVDVRLIAATNRDLGKMVAEKQFRSDLYYRLMVFPITMPPLRERREDIPLLVRYFVDRHARRLNRGITNIPTDVMQALTNWDWPGNIRELENFLERAVILSKGPALRAPLSELIVPELEKKPAQDSSTLQSAEREHILRVLRETKGMIGGLDGAAARLDLKRTTLNSKIKKLGIQRRDYM